MKAARFYKKHQFIVEDVPHSEPAEDEVLIRVHYCGICGTDIHIFEGDKGSMEVVTPRILGHEFSGEVAKAGARANHVAVGDRVSADTNIGCGHCRFCASGQMHLCGDITGLGTAADGGFAEYILVKKDSVFRLPDNISYQSAAMLEPLSCCIHGMELTDVKLGDTVMVVGAGSIGLIMVQLCKHAGAARVIAVEPMEQRRNTAGRCGADLLIDPTVDDTQKVLRENGIVNVDKVIDCAGLVRTAEYAIEHAGKGCTVMLFGLTGPDDVLQLKPFTLFLKELTIKGSFINPYSFDKAMRLLETGIVKTEDIITDIYPLDDIQSVFENKLYRKNGKVLIKTID